LDKEAIFVEIYLNEVKQNINTNDIIKIFELIREKINEEIIMDIYLDEMEVTEEVLVDNQDNLEQDSTLKFETKAVIELIGETLDEVDDYLPKLKQGVQETAQLFREEKLEQARENYELCLQGFEWYINVLQNVLSLLDDKQMHKAGEKVISEFNDVLNEVMRKLEVKDYFIVADLLEKKLVSQIHQFKNLNDKFIEKID
jgi:hypothetical protein